MLNCDCYKAIVVTILLSPKKKRAQTCFKILSKNVFTNHIYLIYMYKEDLALDNQQRLIYHKKQATNQHMHTHTNIHTHTYIYI